MKISNKEIFQNAQNLLNFDIFNIKLPVRINFYLQKNIKLIHEAAKEIEQNRLAIGQFYGELNQEGTEFIIPNEKTKEASCELNDLFNLEQDLNIHIFKLSDFDGIELTYQQMSTIMFMVEED